MITVSVDTKQFDKVFGQYMTVSKRTFEESCNQHAYYIARDATLTTYAADKAQIEEDLRKPSEKYPEAPLAAILVNVARAKKGKRGLTGSQMAQAVDKFIHTRQNHVNFLRSGWIPAIKKLANLVPRKGGTKIPSGVDKKGRNFGGAKPAHATPAVWNIFAEIWNSTAAKGKNSAKTLHYLKDGAQKAVNMETKSMQQYIQRKQDEAARRFWHA